MNKMIVMAVAAPLLLLNACKPGHIPDSGKDISATPVSPAANTVANIRPKGPRPDWAPNIRPQMQAVIEKLGSYGDRPILSLSPAEARKNHTMSDAVRDLLHEYHMPQPVYNITTEKKTIKVDGGTVPITIYTPKNKKAAMPIIVYFHAGGFVLASIEAYAASANILAEKVGAIVISVGYRLAPEHTFPTVHEDAYAAYLWAIENGASINGNPNDIALVGESAGGNLAIATAVKARGNGIMLPKGVISIYPISGTDTQTPSYLKNANVKPLSKPLMEWLNEKYIKKKLMPKITRLNLIAADLRGLPPTTVITAEIDPLLSEDLLLIEKLNEAGVTTYSSHYEGVTHQFFGFGAIILEAQDAEDYAASQLKKVFGQ
ncbi:alpha/beta hydrolase [Olivibacter jilunii]|uniref:alpha/beta hydrolase n=1 Tax=Olivibacter jilunii TaxID=985016 RepID=UPI0013EF5759|nr:alpha/beta hydrolase [Olivibacter jilunii]